MAMRRSWKQRGLTMIEVFIASLILLALVGMSSYLLWSSSRNTETSAAALQLEMQAREFVDAVTKEFHQTKITLIKRLDTKLPIPLDSGSLNSALPPGTEEAMVYYQPDDFTDNSVTPPKLYPKHLHPESDFNGVRFRLPGSPLDLTSANAKDFDLAKFKAGNASAEASAYLYEVQYWWEIDDTQTVSEGVAGAGPRGKVGDGVDNNKNGVIDEGVVYRVETWYLPGGAVERRQVTVACRNVKSLNFYIPSQKWNGTDWKGDHHLPPPKVLPRQIVITLTLEKADPKHPTRTDRNIVKTVSTVIDVRNINQ